MERNNNQNPFLIAVRSAPRAGNNEMVFKYDFNLKDFNTNSFNAAKFEGAIQRSEIEEMKIGLRNAVTLYEIERQGDPIGGYVMLGCCGLGFLSAIGGGIAGIGALSVGGFWGCVIIGVCLAMLFGAMFKKKLLKREQQIRAYLDQVNMNVSFKGLRWTTGRYGGYLMLSYIPTNGAGGGIGAALPLPMNKPLFAPAMPAPTRPAPMGGFGGGFNQPAPPRIPMQPMGGYRPTPYQPAGNQVAPLPLNPPAAGTQPMEPGQGYSNNIIVF